MALAKAQEALSADDPKTAKKFFKQAVGVPDEFVSVVGDPARRRERDRRRERRRRQL